MFIDSVSIMLDRIILKTVVKSAFRATWRNDS